MFYSYSLVRHAKYTEIPWYVTHLYLERGHGKITRRWDSEVYISFPIQFLTFKKKLPNVLSPTFSSTFNKKIRDIYICTHIYIYVFIYVFVSCEVFQISCKNLKYDSIMNHKTMVHQVYSRV